MSARSGGQPLWLISPVVNGVINENRATFFVGTKDDVIVEVNWRFALTGKLHAIKTAGR